jgi:hypothetical protein
LTTTVTRPPDSSPLDSLARFFLAFLASEGKGIRENLLEKKSTSNREIYAISTSNGPAAAFLASTSAMAMSMSSMTCGMKKWRSQKLTKGKI